MGKIRPRQVFLLVLILVLVYSPYAVVNRVSARIRIEGYSMEPALPAGTYVIINKMANDIDDFARGDIVHFYFPRRPEAEYLKRVIGLPGDTVRIADGRVYVNDLALNEPYIDEAPIYLGLWTVPEGELFVLGDKRNHSADSHLWGFVPEECLIGKAVFVYMPAELWGFIEPPSYGASDP